MAFTCHKILGLLYNIQNAVNHNVMCWFDDYDYITFHTFFRTSLMTSCEFRAISGEAHGLEVVMNNGKEKN